MTQGGEIEAEGETEAAGPGPGSHSPGRAPDSPWRMDAAVFSGAKKSEAELQGLRHRSSRFFRRKQAQGIVDYYSKRNELIETFAEVDSLLNGEQELLSEEARLVSERKARIAMRMSFLSNCLLLALKAFIGFTSGSLAIIASALDSLLDLISGAILFLTSRAMNQHDVYKYPIGKERMEPLGVIAFSCIMGTVGFSVLIEAVRQLIGKEHVHHLEELYWLVGVMTFVILVKLALWWYCRNSTSYSVQVYAQDHINDVATNGVGLAGALLGDRVAFWIDPLAAMLLAGYITFTWGQTAYENIMSLVGMSADPLYLQKLTYMCYNHDASIVQVDTVRAYTFGKKLFVEVDIVMPGEMNLREAHDVGEVLQNKLEALPEVERAFVHLDYEGDHKPEHSVSRVPSGHHAGVAAAPRDLPAP